MVWSTGSTGSNRYVLHVEAGADREGTLGTWDPFQYCAYNNLVPFRETPPPLQNDSLAISYIYILNLGHLRTSLPLGGGGIWL